MKIRPFTTLCAILPLVVGAPVSAGDEVDLIRHMGTMQYMVQKTGLAIDARNQPLAGFYVHEIEEVIERLESVESFDGHPIGSLVKSILLPSFEALEDSVKSGDWERASAQFDKFIASCNSCHTRTEHAYIRIQRSAENPFLQAFESR